MRKAGGIYLRNVHQHLAKPVVSPTSQVSVLSFKAEQEELQVNTKIRSETNLRELLIPESHGGATRG